MASSATPAASARARTPRSMFADLGTGRKPVAGFVPALMPLVVLLVATWVNVARLSRNQDHVDHSYRVPRALDIVLADPTNAETGQRGFLVTGEEDYLASFIAGQRALAGDVDTVATLTADNPVQQQRIRQLRPLVQRYFTEMQATVGLRRSEGFQAVRAVILQNKGNSVMDHVRSPTAAMHAEEEGLLGVRRADSAFATQTIRSTLAVAGLVGLIAVARAGTVIGRSSTGPLHRAVAVLQGLAVGRPDQRRRLATRDALGDMSRALDAALDGPRESTQHIEVDAGSLAMAAEGLATTSGTLSARAGESATQAGLVPAATEQLSANVQTAAVGTEETGASSRETAPNAARASQVGAQAVSAVETTPATVTRLGDSSGEIGNVVEVTTSIAQQTSLLALDATIEAARAGEAGKGFAVVANEVERFAQETAKATESIARRVQAIPADIGAAVAATEDISEFVPRISDRQIPVIASLVGVRAAPGAVAYRARAGGLQTVAAGKTLAVTPVGATVYAAARSRAHGPTTALWHAVELHRPVGEVDGACEVTVCGSLVRVSTEQRWPVAARDVCPACATLAH